MRKNHISQSGVFNPRVLLGFVLCSVGVFLGMLSFAATPTGMIRRSDPNRPKSPSSRTQAVTPSQANWTQLGSYTPPTVRQGPTLVSDATTGQLLVFGGQTPIPSESGLQDDTWTFNGQRWIQLHPPASPSAREYAAATYDAAHHLVVLFGGFSANGAVGDTWTWDGTNWTEQHPAHSPPARFGAGMAYDPATQRIVLFGGASITNVPPLTSVETTFGETWTWDGTDWTEQTAAVPAPPARALFGFADGSATSAPVLFGGTVGQGESFGDTWLWNGASNSWVPQPTVSAPSGRFGHAMAYDPRLGKTVLYGGSNLGAGFFFVGSQQLADTWTWDGTQWIQISPTGETPDLRVFGAMSFDPIKEKVTFFAGVGGAAGAGWRNDTWAFDGANWAEEDFTAPDELQSAMLGRESNPGTAILFSGQGEYGGNSTRTWRWTGSEWTLLHPAHSPLSRQWGTLTFDPDTDTTILFGGYVDTYGQPGTRQLYWSNETWSWDGNDWTQLNPATFPPGREYASAAYDAATHQIVLFGGFGDNGTLGDTWTWDGFTWIEQHPANSPSARFTASMAYDPARQKIVLFGGTYINQQYFDETWTWDGTNWTQQQPNNVPPARAYTAMAYDPSLSSAILYGGCTTCFATPTDSDTWSWDGQNWTQLLPSNFPEGRGAHAMVDGDASSPLLMFGGTRVGNGSFDSGTSYLNDLWAFGPAQIAPIPTSVVSRKTHGGAGTFDIDLPLTGSPGIECRTGQGTNSDNHQLIFNFANPVTINGTPKAQVISGIGSVSNIMVSNEQVIVDLTGVANAQTIAITLNNVSDGANSGNVSVSMGVLVGDVNANRSVSNTDVAEVKGQVAAPVTASNFRNDVNANGIISNTDVSNTKAQVGTSLP